MQEDKTGGQDMFESFFFGLWSLLLLIILVQVSVSRAKAKPAELVGEQLAAVMKENNREEILKENKRNRLDRQEDREESIQGRTVHIKNAD